MQGHEGRKNKLCQNTERQKCQVKLGEEEKRKEKECEEVTPVAPRLKPLPRLD